MKITTVTFYLILLLFLSLAFGQDDAVIVKTKIKDYIEKVMAAYEIPGVAIGIVKEGQVFYTKGFGVKNLDTQQPVTENTLFHMASISKPFVATAVMQLVEAGKVDLDESIVKYLPYFRLDDERYAQITVRQMLTHTSGMPDVRDYEWEKPQYDEGALTRYVISLKDKKLIFAPGEKWAYSNMAFEVLGNLIEKVSGVSFENYIKQNILNPIGMKTSDFLLSETNKLLYADPHIRNLKVEVSSVYPYNRIHAPSSTLHSSVLEMCYWAMANLNRGIYKNSRILQAASYNILWKPYSDAYDQRKIGLSWFLRTSDDNLFVEHGGGDLGFAAYFSMMPRQMMAVVIVTNHDYSPVFAINNNIWKILSGSNPEMPRIPIIIPLSNILLESDVSAAIDKYNDLKSNHPDDYNFNEVQLNILGYRLLQAERLPEAIQIFELNVETFPEAYNTYDSLAEAYMLAGEKALAIKNYKKSIELNPENENGKEMLKKLEEGTEVK